MFIPLRTDRPPKRRPIVTEAIIVLNLLVYLVGLAGQFAGWFDIEAFLRFGHFDPERFRLWQLLTSQFLHDPYGLGHLAFNMLFLWIFGSAVEDRLTRIGFLGFYLIGGSVAGLGHMMISDNPAIGASGAIAAVVGAFLALFPRSRIKVLFFFIIIGIYNIPSLWFIGFYFLIDVLSQTAELLGGAKGGVAYMAHIAGNVYGFAMGFALLATGIVKREEFDVFFLFKQSRRRAAFRAASRQQTSGLWDHAPARDAQRPAPRKAAELSEEQQRLASDRAEVMLLVEGRDLPGAAQRYAALLQTTPDAVFAESLQLDLANQLQVDGRPHEAALAYELLLATYPSYSNAADVRLMLGLLYTRSLNEPQQARAMLEKLLSLPTDDEHRALANELLAEIGGDS